MNEYVLSLKKQVEQRRFIVSAYVIKVGKTLDLNHKKHLSCFVQADLFEEDRIKKNH